MARHPPSRTSASRVDRLPTKSCIETDETKPQRSQLTSTRQHFCCLAFGQTPPESRSHLHGSQQLPMTELLNSSMFDSADSSFSNMTNRESSFDLRELSAMLPSVIAAATTHLEAQLDDQVAAIKGRLDQTTQRLSAWQNEARSVANAMSPGKHQTHRLDDIDRTSRRIQV